MWREPPPYYAKLNKQSMNVNPVTNSLKRAYESAGNSTIPIKRPAIFSKRNQNSNDASVYTGAKAEMDELLARFFLNSGISYECVEDPSFVQLMTHFAPHFDLPTPNSMVECVTRLAFPMKVKSVYNFSKAVGPLTATLNTYKVDDEIFLAYSIHFFDDYVQRKNVVFMRKLILSEIDGESVLTYARRSINNFNYGNVRFTNMVTIDEEMAGKMLKTNAVSNNYICFFTYLSRFIETVLKIPDFQLGLDSLRNFIQFLRKHADLYSKFRRLQLSKNGELDLPCLDDEKWTSTTVFLTRCLLLHETFADFAVRFRISSYISDDTYSKLSYLQRLMSHARKFAKELSTPDSSVSQIVPTVVSIKGFLEEKSLGYNFEEDVKSAFRKHLQPLLSLNPENMRYLFATLLDPRYGYRQNIFEIEKWLKIEEELMQMFSLEEVIVNDESAAMVLNVYSKEMRKQKILEELKIYRKVIAASRPNALNNIFHWWGSRILEFTNLYNKSREFLAPPAVAIDTELYFGKGGKWTHMCSKLSYEHLENALSVAGQKETFKGRGYIYESALAPIINTTTPRRRAPSLQKPIKLLKKPTPPPPPQFPDVLMMQPPEAKKSGDLKIEPDLEPVGKDVKQEILEHENEKVDQVQESEEVPNKCSICLRVEKPELLKEAILPNEKLLVLLGMVVVSKLSIDQARLCFSKDSLTLICIRHYKEAADHIFSTLQIRIPDEIFAMPQSRLQPLLDQIFEIRNFGMPLTAFKQLFMIFCEKYPPASLKKSADAEIISFDAIFCADKAENSGNPENRVSLLPKSLRSASQRKPIIIGDNMILMSQEPSSSQPILPKSQRAPRKQILDDDVADNDDMILRRVIPVQIAYDSSPKIKNPGKCSYCGHSVQRSKMIRVPKSEMRRKLWFEKLGAAFERRCKAYENSFMCRAHFSKNCFSANGRLFKNAMPYKIGELKEYEIIDDDFLNQSNDDDFESEENENEEMSRNEPKNNEMLDKIIKEEEIDIPMLLDEIKQEPQDF